MVGRCSPRFITDDINSCILLLKPAKSGVVSGCTTDHVSNGTRKVRDYITTLFNLMISHGFAPIDFRLFTFVPIKKQISAN